MMVTYTADQCACPLSSLVPALQLLGDKYSLQIIALLLQAKYQRFIELEDQINGISPRTLSSRLKQLEASGLINRVQYNTIPPKVEYSLTEKGQGLSAVLNSFAAWSAWALTDDPKMAKETPLSLV